METVVRVAVIYLMILFGLRVMGKREFSQLSPLEFVALLLIPELVSQALVREDFSMTNAIVAVATLFALTFLNSTLMHMSKKWEKVTADEPSILVHHGQLNETSMNKERVTPAELFSEMHKAGLETLDQVKWAILECDGKIAIVPEEDSESSFHDSAAQEETKAG